MGVVYCALDTSIGRKVALKSPLADSTPDRDVLKRFLREARTAASLSHPNVVGIHEIFEQDGIPWIAMDFVEGESLRSRIDRGAPLPMNDILLHAGGLADALRAAHEKRILHRDVNPKNVFLSADGRAMLGDFGLAKRYLPAGEESSASTDSSAATTRGSVVGTLLYMSPEQALGRDLDPRSDIFSLGAVLYEMATARLAFAGAERGEILDKILNQQPAPIGRYNPAAPDDFSSVVFKCLRKRPEERYQTAADLLSDLRRLQRLSQSDVTYEPRPPKPRRVLRVARAAAVAAALVLPYAIFQLLRPDTVPSATPLRVTAAPGWEGAPAVSPDGTRIAYVSNESGDPEIWVIGTRGGEPLQLTHSPGADADPSWLPDGSAILFTSQRTGREAIWKISALGGSPVLLVEDASAPAVSPDGKRVAFARWGGRDYKRIAVAPLGDLSRVEMITADDPAVLDHNDPAWSPDGKLIAYSDSRRIWVVSASGADRRPVTEPGLLDRQPAWSPGGRFIYYSSLQGETMAVWRVRPGGGKPERITLGAGPEIRPSLSRDGKLLAYTTYVESLNIGLIDRGTGERRTLEDVLDSYAPAVSPDGSACAFSSNRGGRPDLYIQPLDGTAPGGAARQITDQAGQVIDPAWSPDQKWIAYKRIFDHRMNIWIVPASGGPSAQFTEAPGIDSQPAWSPGGDEIAFVSERDGRKHVWIRGVSQGNPVGAARRMLSSEGWEISPDWSDDGRFIVYIAAGETTWEAWIKPVDGSAPPRRITTGAGALRVRWDPAVSGNEGLLVAGDFGTAALELREVSVQDGTTRSFDPPVSFGGTSAWPVFNVSKDGRVIAYSQESVSGDIWVLKALDGSF